jgi:hypothetical protein
VRDEANWASLGPVRRERVGRRLAARARLPRAREVAGEWLGARAGVNTPAARITLARRLSMADSLRPLSPESTALAPQTSRLRRRGLDENPGWASAWMPPAWICTVPPSPRGKGTWLLPTCLSTIMARVSMVRVRCRVRPDQVHSGG